MNGFNDLRWEVRVTEPENTEPIENIEAVKYDGIAKGIRMKKLFEGDTGVVLTRNEDNFDLTDGDNYLYSYRSKASWIDEGVDKFKYHFMLRSASTLSIARHQTNINKELSFFPKTVSTGITKISLWPHRKEKG